MHKSQLRRLALDFADGQILTQAYRDRRRELIDGIVDGRVTIEREPPAVPPFTPGDLAFRDVPARGAGAGSGFPWPVWLGGGSLACIVVVIALLAWPAAESPAPAPAMPPTVPVPELSRARTLVESFLARRDFAPGAVSTFEQHWLALPVAERDEARDALWFGSLIRALRDEVTTQKALAGLSGGEAALVRAMRIVALGDALGITGQLPAIGDVRTAALEGFPPTAAGEAAHEVLAPAAVNEAPSAVASAPLSTQPVAEVDLTGRQWLARRNDAELTLQLFAVNGLDHVERLMAAHPDLPVRVLATDGAAPRYRVFHGTFADEAAARRAYDTLPDAITSASGGAIVKSFAAVRDDLAGRIVASPAAAPAAVAAHGYTLQLLASGNRANAESLVKAFPGLRLQLHQLDDEAAPFRVVYGRFESEVSAKAASEGLPAALLSKIGKPLAKPVAETGTFVGP